jgi:hypothetical protein
VTIQIITDMGEIAARKLAEFEAETEVFISLVLETPNKPGFVTYLFTTNGHRDSDVVTSTVERNEKCSA